jgi:hypothetical protein
MSRPVRPIALVILTACMVYPGVTMLFQGLYPFVAGEHFSLVAELGVWMNLAQRFGIPLVVVSLLKAGLGAAWIAGVLGLWAGDWTAYPLALRAAAGTLLYPGGAMVMAVVALVCLIFFREDPNQVPA